MYPFAVTLMIPRALLGILCLLFTVIVTSIVMFGVDPKKSIPSWRRSISKLSYAIGCGLASFVFGMVSVPRFVETDYSEWLGPDYKKHKYP